MAEIKTFTEAKEFWQAAETFAGSPQRLAVSGGSAASFLDHVRLPHAVEIFLADERCVPADHPDSNAGLIRSKLANKIFTDQLDFYQPGKTSAQCAAQYQQRLQTDQSYLLDLVVLGVGPDGHTASLFPASPALEAGGLTVATTAPAEFAVADRLSLTFRALAESKTILVLLQGRGKQAIFETITSQHTNGKDFPARRLLDFPQTKLLFLNN